MSIFGKKWYEKSYKDVWTEADQEAAALHVAKRELREGHGREHICPPLQAKNPKATWDQAEAEVARESRGFLSRLFGG